MGVGRLVAENTFYQILAKVFTAGSVLLLSILITRVLGAEIFGEYSIVLAFITPFSVISELGINAIAVKEFTKDREKSKENFISILFLRVAISLLLIFLANAVLVFFPYPSYIKFAIRIASLLILLQGIYGSFHILFQTNFKYNLLAISALVGGITSLLFTSYAVFQGRSLQHLMLFYVLGFLFFPATALFLIKRYISYSAKHAINLGYWRRIVVLAFPLGIALILNTLMIQADRVILSVMSNKLSVGLYSLSYRIFDLVLVIPTFFMNAVYPLMVKFRESSVSSYQKVVRKSLIALSLISLILSVVAVISSKHLIYIIWGGEMAPAYIPFNILMVGAIFFFLSSPLTWVLIVEGKQKLLPIIYGGAFLFNAVMNVLFIPRFNYVACAVTTIASELLVLIALIKVVKTTRFLKS